MASGVRRWSLRPFPTEPFPPRRAGTNLTVLEARHDQVKRITPDIDRRKDGLCRCVVVIWSTESSSFTVIGHFAVCRSALPEA